MWQLTSARDLKDYFFSVSFRLFTVTLYELNGDDKDLEKEKAYTPLKRDTKNRDQTKSDLMTGSCKHDTVAPLADHSSLTPNYTSQAQNVWTTLKKQKCDKLYKFHIAVSKLS